ncbi:GNAT family N-acetyltransferase [Acholeplasma granularum]|uniref:GNAT family N-acetyltransferase n=1 Tax=Acholeplasma granularum TaxID=264635 RepID=UPI000472EED5|nr:GNAT family protein [Acholeplasma granularum]
MIRLGTFNDLNQIMGVIKQAQLRMKNSGMTQWQNNYPNIDIIKEDITHNHLYVYIMDQQVVGTMSVFSIDSVYDDIIGKWLNDNPYKAIHRIALSNDYVGLNLTSKMIDYVFQYFNIRDIRIDTHPKNLPMIKSLERQGFIKCGVVHVKTDIDSLRYAYHKHI